MADAPTIREPGTPAEWSAYYALRWQVLRQPWKQSPGSERDEDDAEAWHRAAFDVAGTLVGCARLHRRADGQAQVRYMAVAESGRGRGVGGMLLAELERVAGGQGFTSIVLEARTNAVGFYARAGYHDDGPGHRLFGEIEHRVMKKTINH
ncbi:MAG: GNAT family N-acetyltransferase [Chromatiales bacterium]|nr:GNAT family N-acetyltransferase [Chromatiales bacterium]